MIFMKKLLILTILIFLTGCTANIDIKLNDSTVESIIKLTEEDKKLENSNIDMEDMKNDENLEIYTKDLTEFENNTNIKRTFINENNELGYLYNQKLPYEDFESTSLITDCYDDIEIEKDDVLEIKTSEEFTCFEQYETLDKVRLKISSDYELVDTNADVVGGNEYIWNIKKDDINKPIYLALKIKKTNQNYIFIGIVLIISIVIGTLIYLQKKNKNTY